MRFEDEDLPFPLGADEVDDDATDEVDDDEAGDTGVETDNVDAIKAELAKTRKALKKANGEAEKHRLANQTKQDSDKALTAKVEALEKDKQVSEAKLLLKEADALGGKKALDKLVKLLDSTDPDEVEDAVAEVKKTFPALFRKAGSTPPARRGNTHDGGDKDAKKTGAAGWDPTTLKMLGRSS